ncbi:MAG: MBL fold metallo-hydrolase [Chitinophagales bacterium]|jgi:metallo-beta-lactamase family protein|nr:MBL fold metallo-hydrolase [Chitinophagales bacterium]
MKLGFYGASQSVTGTKHLITTENGTQILLDCGLFQGMGKDTDELNRHFGFTPSEIDFLILSHAHIDHSGLIPKLCKDGYQGKIYCSAATKDLAEILLLDSAKIQEEDVRFINKKRTKENKAPIEAIYSTQDAEKALTQFEVIEMNQWIALNDEISVMLTEAGHILGSCVVNLVVTEGDKKHKICFSGDVGRYNSPIIRSPEAFPPCDYLILESTYGASLHEDMLLSPQALKDHIEETCIQNKGKLIIPCFSIGRTQEIVYALNVLETEGKLPKVKFFVDSPLSVKATEITKKHGNLFNKRVQKLIQYDKYPFDFEGLSYITSREDSKSLNQLHEPCVIISSSGMAEAGRVKHHIANNIENPKNKILMVGYCEPNSLGARLLDTHLNEVRIFGTSYQKKAQVAKIKAFSAHADFDDLVQFLSCQNPKDIKDTFLVHGNLDTMEKFKRNLQLLGFQTIHIPKRYQEFII